MKEILLNRDINRATVLVADDQLSLAIGKKGQNVRLAARLTGWNIDILTPNEFEQQRKKASDQLATLTSVGADLARDLVSLGYISLADVAEAEPETLSRVANVPIEQAKEIIAQTAVLVSESEAREAAAPPAPEGGEAAASGEAAPVAAAGEAPAEAASAGAEAAPEAPAEAPAEAASAGPEAAPEAPAEAPADAASAGPEAAPDVPAEAAPGGPEAAAETSGESADAGPAESGPKPPA